MNSIPITPGCSGKKAGWLHISGVAKIQRCFPRIPGKFSTLINILGARILLAEDEPVNREVSLMMLEDLGLVVDAAEDGAEALKLATENDYALILMDMQMPLMDGLESTRRIRQLSQHGLTPIVAMTANAFAEDKTRCLASGMDDFITKPVQPELLYSTMLNWLSRQDRAH